MIRSGTSLVRASRSAVVPRTCGAGVAPRCGPTTIRSARTSSARSRITRCGRPPSTRTLVARALAGNAASSCSRSAMFATSTLAKSGSRSPFDSTTCATCSSASASSASAAALRSTCDAPGERSLATRMLVIRNGMSSLLAVEWLLDAEADAEVTRGRKRVLVRRDACDTVRDLRQRNRTEPGRVEGNHHAALAATEGAHRRRAEAQPEHPVERRRCTTPDHVAECDRARLLARAFRQLRRDLLRDPAVAPRPLRLHCLASLRPRALRTYQDMITVAVLLPPRDVSGEDVDVVGKLGNRDHVRAATDPRVECDPPGVPAHDLDREQPLMRLRRRVQLVDRVRRIGDRRVEAERGPRPDDVPVDRLRHPDHPQAGSCDLVRDLHRAITADHDERIDVVMLERFHDVVDGAPLLEGVA